MTKACIFDCDGVLCDTEKYHFAAWRETAQYLGVDFTIEEYAPFMSRGREAVIKYLLNKAKTVSTAELVSTLSAHKGTAFARLARSVGKSDLIEGAENFVKLLYENGIPMAVASSSSAAEQILKQTHLADYFTYIVDGKLDLPKKPDPSIFLYAANLLGVSPSDCTVFEDSTAGALAAQNGGFPLVGIGDRLSSLPTCDLSVKIIKDFSTATLSLIR